MDKVDWFMTLLGTFSAGFTTALIYERWLSMEFLITYQTEIAWFLSGAFTVIMILILIFLLVWTWEAPPP